MVGLFCAKLLHLNTILLLNSPTTVAAQGLLLAVSGLTPLKGGEKRAIGSLTANSEPPPLPSATNSLLTAI